MYTFLVVIYVLIGILVVFSILIQPSKGSDLGGVFGGGAAQSLLGATGGKALIVKITAGLFAAFVLLSLVLAIKRPSSGSRIQKQLQEEATTQPVLPPAPSSAPAPAPASEPASTPTPAK